MKRVPLFVLASLLPIYALAFDQEQVAQCAAEPDAMTRLICYDAIAQSLAGEAITETASIDTYWSLKTRLSPSANRNDFWLSTQSKTHIELEGESVSPTLTIACEAAKINVSIDWGMYLGIGSIRIKTYFDKHSNRSRIWSIADDNQTVLLSGSDISFIKKMMKHQQLVTEVTPFGQRPVTAEFDLSELTEAVQPIREACKW